MAHFTDRDMSYSLYSVTGLSPSLSPDLSPMNVLIGGADNLLRYGVAVISLLNSLPGVLGNEHDFRERLPLRLQQR